jgi:hypothetical protein
MQSRTNPIWPDATNLTRRKRQAPSTNVVANDGINRIAHLRKPHEVLGSTFDIEFDTDLVSDKHVVAVALSAH